MNTIMSFQEKNKMVKELISKVISENLSVESVFHLFNGDTLRSIGKTSLCRWATLLKGYEDELLPYSSLYFNESIQVKSFEIPCKSKVLYIFKILILILKYTFGHELYKFNQSISSYTYSHDLDISYHALLFYNEGLIIDGKNTQKCLSHILKEHEFFTYHERDYELTIDEKNNKILVDFTYGNDTDRKILLEIQDLLTEKTKLGLKNNIFEIQNNITNITLKMAEILKFEYYKRSESQKLLAIDILLTNIFISLSYHRYNENILRYGIIFFIYADVNEFLTNALYLTIHKSLYHTQIYSKILFKPEIIHHIKKIVKNENFLKETGDDNKKIFVYNFLKILKDFLEEFSMSIIENKIHESINKKTFRIDTIYQKLNLIIQKAIETENLMINFDETNLKVFMESFIDLLDALIFSQKNHWFLSKLIEEESLDSTIINSFRFLKTLRFINKARNDDFTTKIFVSLSETLLKVLKNERCFNRDLIDLIVNETLKFFLVESFGKCKVSHKDLIDNIFKYYFTEEIPISLVSFYNISFLTKMILKTENNGYNLTIINLLIKFYRTNVEFALLLYKENLEVNFEYEIFNDYLKNLTGAELNFDYVIEYICDENNYKTIDLDLYDIYKPAFYADSFVKNVHKYFEDKNKSVIDIFFYYEFHLPNLVSFLTYIFKYININLAFQNSNCIDLLIKKPEFLFFSKTKWLIWDIAKLITLRTSSSYGIFEFFSKFFEYTLEKLTMLSLDKKLYSGSNESELSGILCYIIDFLMYFNHNLNFIYKIKDLDLKEEIQMKIFQIFKIIYSGIFFSIDIPFIERDLKLIDQKAYCENIKNILKSKEITLNELYELCYISLLGIVPIFGFQYTELLFDAFIMLDTPNKFKKVPENDKYDPNILYLYYLHMKYNFISIDLFFTAVFDTFHKLSNIALKYSSEHEIFKPDTCSIIEKSIELFIFAINNMKKNHAHSSSKYILQFIENNIHIFTAAIFMDIFTNKIWKYPYLVIVFSDIILFDTIVRIIHSIDKKSLKSLHTNDKIESNTLLYDFLHISFYNLKYSETFINGQNTCESLFSFIYNEINENPDIHQKFMPEPIFADVNTIYSILISNINININKEKKLSYKKEILFGFFLSNNFIIKEDVFLYLISLIRLSEFSNIFTKMEIYQIFGYKKVIDFISGKKDCIYFNANILNYSYLYLRCLLEDDLYILSSLMYITRNYSNLSESVFRYFYSRLIIYNRQTIFDDTILNKEEWDLKRRIIFDIFNITKTGERFKQIISLQILTEIISAFPSLIYIMDFKYLMDLFYKHASYRMHDDKFNSKKQEIWYLNFKTEYLFTILLYKLDEEFMSKLIVSFFQKLSSSKTNEIYSIISFIYKVLLSEICCCRYTQNIFCSAQESCDLNCESNFLERRIRIVDKLVKIGLLNKLLSVYNLHERIYRYTMKIIDFVIDLASDQNYIPKRKFLMNNASIARSSSKKSIFIPDFLEKCIINEIEQIEFDVNGEKKEPILFKFSQKKFLQLDFGYKTRTHLLRCNYRFLYMFIFSDSKIRITNYNFDIEEFDSTTLFINKFEIDFKKLKFIEKVSNYRFPYPFLINLAEKLGLETSILPENRDYQCFSEDKYFKEYSAYYSNKNTNNISCLDYGYHTLATVFESANLLTIKQLAEIFLSLLVNNKMFFSTASINVLKGIASFCTRKKLVDEFYSIFSENVRSYKTEVKDKRTLKNVQILAIIVTEMNFIEIFASDFLTIEILMVIVNVLINDRLSCFNKNLDLKMLIKTVFIEKKSSQCFLIDNIIHNFDKINSIYPNLGLFIVLDCIFLFTKIMKNTIFNVLFDSSNCDENISINLYFQGLEKLLFNLNIFSLKISFDSFDFLYSYLIEMSRILLHNNFIKFIVDKSFNSDCLFNLYNKLIIENSLLYSSTRNKVFEDEYCRMKRLGFIYTDFLCLLFDIKDLNFLREIYSRITFYQMNQLYCFIDHIYRHKGNEFKSLYFFYSTDLTTKLMICKMKHLKGINFQVCYLCLRIDRKNILNSTLDSIHCFDNESLKNDIWQIKFQFELGEGVGLTYDFFNLFGKAIDECPFFESFKDLEFYDKSKIKNKDDKFIKRLYYYTGLIMAKSIMMNTTLGFEFIDSFYLFLLKEKFTIEDIKLVDNEFYENLIKFRNEKNIAALELTFSIDFSNSDNTLEFVPNGSNISVTDSNIEEYLQIITEFKLFKHMTVYLEAMKQGFKFIMDDYLGDIFTLKELKLLIEGCKAIDIDAWVSSTKYSKEFHKSHKVIVCFWEFVRESTTETQKKIFYFVTGLEKLPTGGFDSIKFYENPFTIESSSSTNLLPCSQTCTNLLIIPLYEDKKTLIDKFMIALEYKEYGSI